MSENITRALDLFKKKDYRNAIGAFEEVLKEDPKNAEIYNNIGVCYYALGEEDMAEENYKKALALNPAIAQAYINLTDVYYRKRDFLAAIDLLLQGEYELPDDVVIPHYLARVYMEDSRLDLAIDELDKVLDKQPDNYDAYYDLGRVSFELGNYEDAISNFENVIQYKDNNELVFYALAEAYEANDEIDKAISNYLKAIAVNDKFHPAYKKIATLFLAKNDISSAIEYFEEYLEFEQLPKEERDNVGKIVERLRQKNG